MDSVIDEVKSRTDIVALISQYVSLTKKGKNYWANCPFHGEKTPSFSVSAERQIFKCFGCGEGGSAFTFYEKMEGVGFGEALRVLAKRAGVKLENQYEDKSEKEKDVLFEVNQKATEFYHYLLTKHSAGQKAQEYLKGRGITDESIKEFKLGFAPDEWESLTSYLIKKGISQDDIINSGLSLPSPRGKTPYDRFRNRVMFPVFNLSGQVVGFSGRILGNGEPKYLNSPDTKIFNKSFCLYGLHQAKTELKKENLALLVEGNLDVISSYQAGVSNVLAPLGTALTSAQLSIIKRFTDRLALCFDTDSAGVAATKRAIDLAENQDFNIKIIDLPSGKDPDDCIRENSESWKVAVGAPVDIYEYYLTSLIKKHGINSAEGKKRIVGEYLPYLSKIKNDVTKGFYKDKLATTLGVEASIVDRALDKKTADTSVSTPTLPASQGVTKKNRQNMLEDYLLSLVLQSGILHSEIMELEYTSPNFKDLVGYIKEASNDKGKIDQPTLESFIPQNLSEDFDRLTLTQLGEDILEDPELINKEIENTIRELREINVKSKLKVLSVEIKQAEMTGNSDKVNELRQQFQDVSSVLTSVNTQ